MLISELVMQEAFAGVVYSPKQILSSRNFHDRVFREKRLLRSVPSRDTVEGRAIRFGHLECGARINPSGDLSLLNESVPDSVTPYDVRDRARLRLFGDELLSSAHDVLPPNLTKLALDFGRTSSAKRQLEIGAELCHALEMPSADSEIRDMCNQPAGRVLPLRYKNWKTSKLRPNCLGKAQLVAAFINASNARAYCAVPFASIQEYTRLKAGEFSRCALGLIELNWPKESHSSQMASLIRRQLMEYGHLGFNIERRPSYPHASVAVQLKDNSWAIIDPNFGISAVLPDDIPMDEIAAKLDHLSPVLPGITISARSEFVEKKLRLESGWEFLEVAGRFRHELSRSNFNPARAVRFIEQSKLLRRMRDLCTKTAETRTADDLRKEMKERVVQRIFTDREVAIQLLLDGVEDCEMNRIEKQRRSVTGRYGDVLNRENTEGALIRASLFVILLYLDQFNKSLETLEAMPGPEYEFGALNYQLGMHTLRHVSIDMNHADTTNAALLEHGFGQYLLLDAFSVLVRSDRWREVNPHAERAESILRALPYRLRSATCLLEDRNERSLT